VEYRFKYTHANKTRSFPRRLKMIA